MPHEGDNKLVLMFKTIKILLNKKQPSESVDTHNRLCK